MWTRTRQMYQALFVCRGRRCSSRATPSRSVADRPARPHHFRHRRPARLPGRLAYSCGVPAMPLEPGATPQQAIFPDGQYPVSLPAASLLGARNDLPNPFQPGVDFGAAAGRTQMGIDSERHDGARQHDLGRRSLRQFRRRRHDVRRRERDRQPDLPVRHLGEAAEDVWRGDVRQPAQADGR